MSGRISALHWKGKVRDGSLLISEEKTSLMAIPHRFSFGRHCLSREEVKRENDVRKKGRMKRERR